MSKMSTPSAQRERAGWNSKTMRNLHHAKIKAGEQNLSIFHCLLVHLCVHVSCVHTHSDGACAYVEHSNSSEPLAGEQPTSAHPPQVLGNQACQMVCVFSHVPTEGSSTPTHLRCLVIRRATDGVRLFVTDLLCEPKICHLDVALRIQKQILWFEVAVHDALVVEELREINTEAKKNK